MFRLHERFFLTLMYSSYILYFVILLGIVNYAPFYFDYLKNFLKIYIGFLLVYLYNPITYKKKDFTNIDREIIFSAGIFLLLSTTVISSIESYFTFYSKDLLIKNYKKIINY
jgi:hypothetical protein